MEQHLELAFNMPTSRWWESVGEAFTELQELTGSKPSAAFDEKYPVDEYAASARLARAASLPSIILLPSENHALGLTATDEALQCAAFGTVGRTRFVELLWESIVEAQGSGAAKFVVHEVLQGVIPKITLRVETHLIAMRYLQCEALVRAHPSIIDAPSAFLQDRNNCSATIQQEVQKLQQSSKLQEKFKGCPNYRRAYYYKRAWAVAWGLFNNDKETRDIFELCDQASLECSGDFSSIVFCFVEQWRRQYPQTPDYQSSDWDQLLSLIEAEPLHKKLDYPHYLQVTVLYTGSSSMKGSEWLLMVEHRLEWLKINLNALLSVPNLTTEPVKCARLWPQRLVRSYADPEDGVYEGCFVFGFDIDESALSTVTQVAERWKQAVEDDDLTIKGRCFLETIISQGKAEIEKQDLRPCKRTWPRPIVKAETGPNKSQSLKLSKREKRELSKGQKDQGTLKTPVDASKMTKKLRPASDVLGRLRYGRDYDIDKFVVGYKDRHSSKLKEKPAVLWAKDTTDDEFIPEHRIEYFKRYNADGKEKVFWDKSLRLDKIFQHGGSG